MDLTIIHSPWNSKWKSWDEWSLSVNKGGSGTFHNSLYTDQNNAIPGGINNRKLHSFSQQLTHIAGNLYFGYMIKDTSEHSDLLTNVCSMYIHIIIGKYVF